MATVLKRSEDPLWLVDLPRQDVRDQRLSIQPLDKVQQPVGSVHSRADDREKPVLNCSPDRQTHGSPMGLMAYWDPTRG